MKKTIFIFCISLLQSFIFFSDDCKAQWEQMSNGLGNDKYISSISVSGDNYYVSVFNGVYKSTNNGIEWVQTSLGNLYTISVAANGNYVYTSVYDFCNNASGVYRSTDNGLSWIQTSFIEQYIPTLAIIGNNVFAGTWECIYPGGVFMSSDNGINWANTPITNIDVTAFCINDSSLYAGMAYSPFSTGGIYHSKDMGASWSFLGLGNRSVMSIAVSNDRIYAGTLSSGIFVTTNNGANWTQTSLNNQRVLSIVINGENVLAGTLSGGVYLSRDNGLNWIQKNEGLDTLYIQSLLISNDYIFAGSMGKGVYRRSLSEIVNVKQTSELLPSEYSLHQNYPNPFNPSTNIRFDIPQSALVKLTIYDALGREVTTLVNENLTAGSYNYQFSTDQYQLPSGVYFYNLQAGEFNETRRMLMIK